MKLYLSHSRSHDYENELYKPLKQIGHDIFLPHDENNGDVKTKQIIESSDVVLAEVSYPATGSGIELGWASAAGVEIVCMHKKDAKISGSLRYISNTFIEYSDVKDMAQKVSSLLGVRR